MTGGFFIPWNCAVKRWGLSAPEKSVLLLWMKVVCNTAHPEKHADLGVKFVSLPELLASSDVVSVHTPLTETTRGLLNAENLALLKPGAILVNASRMGVTDKQL